MRLPFFAPPCDGPRHRPRRRRRRSRAAGQALALEGLGDDLGDLEEAELAREERGDGCLVGRVVGTRRRSASLAGRRVQGQAAGKSSRSGAANSSVRPAARSSCSTGVADRSGYVNANEIGTRMSGRPRCASIAPSRKRTSAVDDRGRMDDDLDAGRTARRRAGCASISSRPLLASVAESTVIFGPIAQVGWASASATVTVDSS